MGVPCANPDFDQAIYQTNFATIRLGKWSLKMSVFTYEYKLIEFIKNILNISTMIQ